MRGKVFGTEVDLPLLHTLVGVLLVVLLSFIVVMSVFGSFSTNPNFSASAEEMEAMCLFFALSAAGMVTLFPLLCLWFLTIRVSHPFFVGKGRGSISGFRKAMAGWVIFTFGMMPFYFETHASRSGSLTPAMRLQVQRFAETIPAYFWVPLIGVALSLACFLTVRYYTNWVKLHGTNNS